MTIASCRASGRRFLFYSFFCVADSGYPEQTPRSVASELGLHCMHNTSKGVSGLESSSTGCTILLPNTEDPRLTTEFVIKYFAVKSNLLL